MIITDELLNDLEQDYVLLNEKIYSYECIRGLFDKGLIYHPLVCSENLENNLGRDDFRIKLYRLDRIELCNCNGWIEVAAYLNRYESYKTGIEKIYIKL